jgi:hypothetical protein
MAKAIESIESPTPKEGVGWGYRRGPDPQTPPPKGRACMDTSHTAKIFPK